MARRRGRVCDLDFHGFTRLFHSRGLLTNPEFDLCQRVYSFLRALLPRPELIIRLRADERMYVLPPHESATYEGWRTERDTVNRFYFTEPGDSYAAAFGDRSAMGVIAVAAFREVIDACIKDFTVPMLKPNDAMIEKALEKAKATDQCIREHPYQTLGIAFALGLVLVAAPTFTVHVSSSMAAAGCCSPGASAAPPACCCCLCCTCCCMLGCW